MSSRLRILLVILVLSSCLYVWLNVDWREPFTLYRNYQRIQAVLENNKEALDRAQQLMKDEFGENTSMNYNVSISSDGVMTTKIQGRRNCGSLDGKRYLEAAIQRTHEAGLGWADEVEYVYSCKVNKSSFEAAK